MRIIKRCKNSMWFAKFLSNKSELYTVFGKFFFTKTLISWALHFAIHNLIRLSVSLSSVLEGGSVYILNRPRRPFFGEHIFRNVDN